MNCCTHSVSSRQGHLHCSTVIIKRDRKGEKERATTTSLEGGKGITIGNTGNNEG